MKLLHRCQKSIKHADDSSRVLQLLMFVCVHIKKMSQCSFVLMYGKLFSYHFRFSRPKQSDDLLIGEVLVQMALEGRTKGIIDKRKRIEYTEVLLPQSKEAEIYEKYYRLYREIYEQTKGSMDALSSISKD